MFKKILFEALPPIIMIGLIQFVQNDYTLSGLYIFIIFISFKLKMDKKDAVAFIAGLIVMFIFENYFVSTGVETFNRNSLFGMMPLWLPLLWAYGFVAIKRLLYILDGSKI